MKERSITGPEHAQHGRDVNALQRSHDIQVLISSLLHLSLKEEPLDTLLSQSLDLILSLNWLSFESKGSIFVVEDDPEVLVMKGVKGLAEPLLKECARVAFGKCLCGKAAKENNIKFQASLDGEHEISYEGISPHGHYCIPIRGDKDLLGILNIYLKEGYIRSDSDEEFLTAVTDTLAGIITRKQLEKELRRLATVDVLTGAYNRRKFDEIITNEIERAERYQQLLSIVMLDIDDFKTVNDSYGHNVGDSVLRDLAEVIMANKRTIDSLIRWGGEEFMIVAPGTGLDGAKVLSERIRKKIEAYQFETASKITVSVGATQFRQGDVEDSLIKRADDALYKAKATGKNRLVVAT